jgi:hypothetical protein
MSRLTVLGWTFNFRAIARTVPRRVNGYCFNSRMTFRIIPRQAL